MVRLLVSVRDVAEALMAADAGADFIDCKEPAAGALGALAPERIAQIVAALRAGYPGLRISATIGDLPSQETREILRRVEQVAACGVDYVKVGVEASGAALLGDLSAADCSVVPVLLADEGVDPALLGQALKRPAFPALMLDTARKGDGSLLQRVPLAQLADFVAAVQAGGMLAGLAGSLRLEDAATLRALDPDFAGFRGALTRGARDAALDARRVRALKLRLASGASAPLPLVA